MADSGPSLVRRLGPLLVAAVVGGLITYAVVSGDGDGDTGEAASPTTATSEVGPTTTTDEDGDAEALVRANDALSRRVVAELDRFAGWCATYDVECVIGEVGWPAFSDDPTETNRWSGLAEAWFAALDERGLGAMVWATGEWWGEVYGLSPYVDVDAKGGVHQIRAPGIVLERHLDAPRRGVNVAGAEFGAPGPFETPSEFSNANPGEIENRYHYDTAATFEYLASRGIELIRMPIRWERIQSAPGGPLVEAEVDRLTAAIGRAHGAGLSVVIDVHNYAGYWVHDGTQGVRRSLGDVALGDQPLPDLWRRLAERFRDVAGVAAYGLMNEPIDVVPADDGSTPARTWERIAQQTVDAIRAVDTETEIWVGGYAFSSGPFWLDNHESPFISDPSDRVVYEAHQYFDRDTSGQYRDRYADEVADAASRGF